MPRGIPEPAEIRFHRSYEVDPKSHCWNWKGTFNNKGYGQIFRLGMGMKLAHRLSWEVHRGPIPAQTFCLHRCDNPKCVNPRHLYLGDQKRNLSDMAKRGRSCKGTKNGMAVLTNKIVRAIRQSKEGMTACARRYGICYQHVWLIRKRRIWKHV